MYKLNWNTTVKVKLNDNGKDIYYHRHDRLNEYFIERGIGKLNQNYPKVDNDGFTEFQLWYFMNLYGEHIHMGYPDVVEEIYFYIDESDMDKAE